MASYDEYAEDWDNGERKRERATRDSYRERERNQVRERHHGNDRSDQDLGNDIHGHRSREGDRSRDKERKSRDRSRERERHRHDYDAERRNKHKARSHSRGKSRERSKSPSRSHERRSKRTSGFDMAPPGVATMSTPSLPGPLTGVSQLPMQGAFSFPNTQFPTVPMPAMTQQATRHARRVYVGGLPAFANEQTIAAFFSQVMAAIGGNTAGPGDAVVNVYINHEKKFAFVEMRTVEEASNAMSLDGIMFENQTLRVRRPSDYNPSLAATLGPSQPSAHLNLAAVGLTPGASGGADGPDKIFVGGLPYYLTETQIRELLESFGPLRGFDLVKDWETGNSKGYAFCVYQDTAVTDVACSALNGLKMGDKTLTVRRASASAQQKSDQSEILLQAQQQIAMQKLAFQTGGTASFGGLQGLMGLVNGAQEIPTKVICLDQLVSVDDLKDDEEYEEIYEDIKEECGKFGTVINLMIPRPQSTGEDVPGLGKAFAEYSSLHESSKAKNSLHLRKFAGNTVIATFYPEDKFTRKELDG